MLQRVDIARSQIPILDQDQFVADDTPGWDIPSEMGSSEGFVAELIAKVCIVENDPKDRIESVLMSVIPAKLSASLDRGVRVGTWQSNASKHAIAVRGVYCPTESIF
jgi:hypothetical protein